MKYKTRSIIIGRKKGTEEDVRPCFIALYDKNNPHKNAEAPKELIDYEEVHKVFLKGLDVNYLLPGNDLVVNDLEYVEIRKEGPHVVITGKQKK